MTSWQPPRDFVGYGPVPPNPKWPNDAQLAVNFVINYEEGSEPSIQDGDGYTESALVEASGPPGGVKGRDLAAESMFEYGSRVGFWRLHRLFEERGIPVTIFGCSLAIERNSTVAAAIREADYDVCCHGWRWIKHFELTEPEEREQIKKAVASLKATIGRRPEGWYCRYGPSINTRRLLVEEGGFLYDSDSYADELPYWQLVNGQAHLIVPYSLTNNDAKLAGGAATSDQWFSFVRDAFDLLYAEGERQPKMMSIGLHARFIGHPSRASGLARFLDHVIRHRKVWVTRRLDIARHWVAEHPH